MNTCIKRIHLSGLLAAAFLLVVANPTAAAPTLANTGVITMLAGTGAANPGDSIAISSQVRADSRVVVSNLFYELFEPGGARVDTHQTNPSRLQPGETFRDTWSSSNTPTRGTYTVTLCWSTGQAHNCDIASATTSFYSVPTLGPVLTAVAVLLLACLLWINRHDFETRAA